jgi:hypothetical protein
VLQDLQQLRDDPDGGALESIIIKQVVAFPHEMFAALEQERVCERDVQVLGVEREACRTTPSRRSRIVWYWCAGAGE